MKNIVETLAVLEKLTPMGVSYPPELLAKHNPQVPLDAACLSYLVNGGVAGAYFHWLTLLMKHLEPRLTVELGNRYGSSTIALFHGMASDQTLITMDIDHDQRYVPQKIMQSDQVKFVFGDCIDLNVYEENKIDIPIDIECLFTDTVHCYEQLSSEYQVYESLLADEAVIVIDDINLNDKRVFWEEVNCHSKYDLTDLCHGGGFGAIHYIRPVSERNRTKEERIQLALKRSSTIWKNRFLRLHDDPSVLLNRIREIRRKRNTKMLRRMGISLMGEKLYTKIRGWI